MSLRLVPEESDPRRPASPRLLGGLPRFLVPPPASVRKSSRSQRNAFSSPAGFPNTRLMTTIRAVRINVTHPILSINGISGVRYLNPAERGIVESATTSAAVAVARFQKKPRRNITQTPGLMKPVYSWIYWMAWSSLLSCGVIATAIKPDTTMELRPTRISVASLAFGLT